MTSSEEYFFESLNKQGCGLARKGHENAVNVNINKICSYFADSHSLSQSARISRIF